MPLVINQKRLVDPILTKVVLGYNLDNHFTGHHLFPDVFVNEMQGKIVKFGKDAFIIVDSKVAPGQTIKGVGLSYGTDVYSLIIRKLKALSPEEFIELADKVKAIKSKSRAVNNVMQKMRREGEYDKAKLATTASNYPSNNVITLSGSSQWNDPTADVLQQVQDAKATVRAKIGQEPNVFHLDYKGYLGLKNNERIRKACFPKGDGVVTIKHLAEVFELEQIVVGKSLHLPDKNGDFEDIWKDNSVLAYVAPKALRDKAEPSYGYNYVQEKYPYVGKEYFDEDTDTWNNKVYFRDNAIMTYPEAGFLFANTTGA